jgi:hypothetical protein
LNKWRRTRELNATVLADKVPRPVMSGQFHVLTHIDLHPGSFQYPPCSPGHWKQLLLCPATAKTVTLAAFLPQGRQIPPGTVKILHGIADRRDFSRKIPG